VTGALAGYGWQGSWLVAGGAGFWGALATWVGVGSSSPQVPGHPTSMCDAGVKTLYTAVKILCRLVLFDFIYKLFPNRL